VFAAAEVEGFLSSFFAFVTVELDSIGSARVRFGDCVSDIPQSLPRAAGAYIDSSERERER
jgi:hypothetical protein